MKRIGAFMIVSVVCAATMLPGPIASAQERGKPMYVEVKLPGFSQQGHLSHHRPQSRAVVRLDHDLQVLTQASDTGPLTGASWPAACASGAEPEGPC